MTINDSDPVLLVEESLRFKTPTVVETFTSMAEARERMREIILVLSCNMRCFDVNYTGDVTWFGRHRPNEEGEMTRFVRARFRLVRLADVLEGFKVRTDTCPLEYIRESVGH